MGSFDVADDAIAFAERQMHLLEQGEIHGELQISHAVGGNRFLS